MLEDSEIIRRCQSGQMGLMDILIDRYKTDLYSLCMRMTGNGPDADDLFQDTWIRVLKGLDSYSGKHRFKTWLFAICLNRYRDLYRWRKRWWRRLKQVGAGEHSEENPKFLISPDTGPEERMVSEEETIAVKTAVDKLEDIFRMPVLLHYFQDLSTEEIGEVLGIPQGTVKTRLHRARELLRSAMEDQGHG